MKCVAMLLNAGAVFSMDVKNEVCTAECTTDNLQCGNSTHYIVWVLDDIMYM